MRSILSDLIGLFGVLAIFTIGWYSHDLDYKRHVRPVIVHSDVGQPVDPDALAEWTPHRVEAIFDSGLSVVSSLGPHGNFQYIVHDLHLPVGATFRNLNGYVVKVM